MKIYISGKISGTKDFRERFQKAEENLKKDGWDTINPVAIGDLLPASTTYKQFMEIDLKLLTMCEAIYLIPGWETSEGAKTERQLAEALGLVILNGGE